MHGSEKNIGRLTELKVDGIILWPNLNAAAANSLLILRYIYVFTIKAIFMFSQ